MCCQLGIFLSRFVSVFELCCQLGFFSRFVRFCSICSQGLKTRIGHVSLVVEKCTEVYANSPEVYANGPELYANLV